MWGVGGIERSGVHPPLSSDRACLHTVFSSLESVPLAILCHVFLRLSHFRVLSYPLIGSGNQAGFQSHVYD